jgi:hypothetical protein
METYFGELLRRVDSSLLEEWEKLRNPDFVAIELEENRPLGAEEALADITRDEKTFTGLIRTRIFEFLAALLRGDWEEAMDALGQSGADEVGNAGHARLSGDTPAWNPMLLWEALERYKSDHGPYRLDPEGRSWRHTHVDKSTGESLWSVTHMLQDDKDLNDGVVVVSVDLEASRRMGSPFLTLIAFGDGS